MGSSEPRLAFCESIYAGPTSPEHIRVVGPEGLRHGGGVNGKALCGRDLHGGWDIRRPVTVPDSSEPWLCETCRCAALAGDPDETEAGHGQQ